MASHPVRDSILIIPKAESPNGVCAGIVTLPCKQFMGFYDVHMNFLESLGVSAKADLIGFIATFSISNVANANDKWVSSCWCFVILPKQSDSKTKRPFSKTIWQPFSMFPCGLTLDGSSQRCTRRRAFLPRIGDRSGDRHYGWIVRSESCTKSWIKVKDMNESAWFLPHLRSQMKVHRYLNGTSPRTCGQICHLQLD